MCEYCGCHQNEYIAELMDQHDRLASLGDSAVRALDAGDTTTASSTMHEFVALLHRHNELEERGIFAAVRDLGEFVELIDELAREHTSLHARLDDFGPVPPQDALQETVAGPGGPRGEGEPRGVPVRLQRAVAG